MSYLLLFSDFGWTHWWCSATQTDTNRQHSRVYRDMQDMCLQRYTWWSSFSHTLASGPSEYPPHSAVSWPRWTAMPARPKVHPSPEYGLHLIWVCNSVHDSNPVRIKPGSPFTPWYSQLKLSISQCNKSPKKYTTCTKAFLATQRQSACIH